MACGVAKEFSHNHVQPRNYNNNFNKKKNCITQVHEF